VGGGADDAGGEKAEHRCRHGAVDGYARGVSQRGDDRDAADPGQADEHSCDKRGSDDDPEHRRRLGWGSRL